MSYVDNAEAWGDFREQWKGDTPDARLAFEYRVYSRDHLIDVAQRFSDTALGLWMDSCKTMAGAYSLYKKRIKRPKTKECFIELKVNFGGVWGVYKTPFRPEFKETYIVIARWRADMAYMESYHVNESKYWERNNEACDELERGRKPGLMFYWNEKHRETEKEENEKKKKRKIKK